MIKLIVTNYNRYKHEITKGQFPIEIEITEEIYPFLSTVDPLRYTEKNKNRFLNPIFNRDIITQDTYDKLKELICKYNHDLKFNNKFQKVIDEES